MKTLIVGGTWDSIGGKKSSLIDKIYKLMINYSLDIDYYNGGKYDDLNKIINQAKDYDVIYWLANVPNDLPKIRNIKSINPYAIVVGSKRNDHKYSFVEVLNRALMQRHNLTIQFTKDDDKFKMLLFDPLGTAWYEGFSIDELVYNLTKRINFIYTTTRQNTYPNYKQIKVPDDKEFFDYVRYVAEIFHKTIEHDKGVTRFLGNASFRYDSTIYVSRRDVDKSLIDKDNFVGVYLDNNRLYYYGNNKPSKDAVVQANLYLIFKNVNYMIHSHCYAQDGYFTRMPVPCGALEEIDEVIEVVSKYYNNNYDLDYYTINLNGHGCLVLASSLDHLKRTNYVTRHLPEYIENKGISYVKKR